MESLADYLAKKEDVILQDWKESLEEGEDQISNLISLSREKFYDHIPLYLDQLYKILRNGDPSTEKVAKKHGSLRWEYGFDLREVAKEWAKLHEVLMKHTSEFQESVSLKRPDYDKAREIIAQLIHEGIINSINEYYKLQNQETTAKIDYLSKVLQEEKKEKLDHSEQLQQTTHDLRGYLYSLRMGLSLLDNQNLSDKSTEIVDDMSTATEDLGQLLNDLLDLFKLEAGHEEVEITSFDAADVLTELCNSLQPLAEANDLDLICEGKEPFPIEGDVTKLKRIAQNLLVNSLKYTQSGYVKIRWEKGAKNNWIMTISDSGPGFSNSDENKKSEDDGEGIGLLIVRKLCKILDAIIDITSDPDDGTVFKIVFPLEDRSATDTTIERE